jgi:hypothetical protein
MAKELKEAVIVQFYLERGDQVYVAYLDYNEVKDRTDPNHPKHDPQWSTVLANAIANALSDPDKLDSVDWNVQDYAETCVAKLPFNVRKHSITLYM